jgi:hypothetical protein
MVHCLCFNQPMIAGRGTGYHEFANPDGDEIN